MPPVVLARLFIACGAAAAVFNFAAQQETVAFCRAHNITVLAYSPMGIPDWHSYPVPALPTNTTLADPVVQQVAAAHGLRPGQVIVAWLWARGFPCNPRSMNVNHMMDNLSSYAVSSQLTPAELTALSTRPLDTCAVDPSFYECAPVTGTSALGAAVQAARSGSRA